MEQQFHTNKLLAGDNAERFKLSFELLRTIEMTSRGTPIDAIDNKTPTAFEEGFHGATTWTQVGQNDGSFGIRYTNADILPLGLKLDTMYFPTVGVVTQLLTKVHLERLMHIMTIHTR